MLMNLLNCHVFASAPRHKHVVCQVVPHPVEGLMTICIKAPGHKGSALKARHTVSKKPLILEKLDADVAEEKVRKSLFATPLAPSITHQYDVPGMNGIAVSRCWYVKMT